VGPRRGNIVTISAKKVYTKDVVNCLEAIGYKVGRTPIVKAVELNQRGWIPAVLNRKQPGMVPPRCFCPLHKELFRFIKKKADSLASCFRNYITKLITNHMSDRLN